MMKIYIGSVLLVVSIVAGALTIPYSFAGSRSASQEGGGVEITIESDGFQTKVAQRILGDPEKVTFSYETGWALSVIALIICGFLLSLSVLLIRRGMEERKQEIASMNC
ncbi:uncharacterized protein METZ01_LOCUS448956 [marine metagenome]|jgi:hypothetical protein|uniref:PDGLE domain-containing protein n=1 Tax=marine metagenome TaxID=408172 RepID=A0A382ZKW4_9ZZZZ